MGVVSGYGCKELIDFLILLIPTPLVSALFCNINRTFCSVCKKNSFLYNLGLGSMKYSLFGFMHCSNFYHFGNL